MHEREREREICMSARIDRKREVRMKGYTEELDNSRREI
jgi:hypothetical protein